MNKSTEYKTMQAITPILSKVKTVMRYNFILVAFLLLSVNGWGQTAIAAWDFTGIGSTTISSMAATVFDQYLSTTFSANYITRGSGAPYSVGSNSWRTTGFQNNGINTSNTDYFQITLTAVSGYKVSLSTIDAKFAGTSSFNANPGVTSQFAYSLDGINFTLIGSPVTSTSLTLSQISLSSISALQNVASGTTIYLRYYASGQTTTGGWGFNSPASGQYGLAIGGTTALSSCTPPAAPTATASQILCPSATVNSLAATGTAIQWYDAASGGNLLSSSTALTHNTHYYATQTVNGCESSTRTDVTASLQNVWSGNASNWNNASNWSCGNVPSATENVLINSGSPALDINYEVPATYTLTLSGGSLTINPGNKLTITGTADFGNQLVTVAANASNTGAIVLNGGSLQNATNVALQQWFTGQRAWRMLSNPFTTSITGSSIASDNTGFSVNQSGTGDMVVYNSSTDTWSANTTIAANTCYGFFFKGLQSDFTGTPGLSNYSGAGPTASVFSVKGTLNTGSVTITPSNASPAYTLVGNPFAAPVNSIALTGGAAAPYYYYQANAASTDSKVKSGAWIAASSNSSNTTTIPMMGLIAYQAPSTSSFTIPIAAINTAGTAVSALFKTTAAATQLNIDLMKNNTLFDRCIVREDIDANAQRIDQKDLLKMENVTANVYALTPANDRLAVYTEPAFTQAIPLVISAPVGTYQFNIQNDMNSMADWYLIDNYTHQQQLLTNNSTYIFDINNDAASKGSQRFELSKQAWTTSVGTASNQDPIQLLGNLVQDHITLQLDAKILQASYQLLDIRGAVLAQGTLMAGKQEIAMASFVSGMYLLHIQNDQQHSVYKITKY
jgi:hypothetical protein